MAFTFRPATPAESDIITDFNCRLAAETEDKTLPADVVSRGVQRGFQQGAEVQYFVAEDGDTVIGQIMLTREWSDWRDGWAAWIQSVYVHADYRGQGVFRQLFHHVAEQLQQDPDVVLVRLYVEQDNAPAIATYQKLGFTDPGYRVMELPLGRDAAAGEGGRDAAAGEGVG